MAKRKQAKRSLIRAAQLTHPEKYRAAILDRDLTIQDGDVQIIIPAGEKMPIQARSRWEMTFIRWCDTNQDVLEWASEPWEIPYQDPLTKSQKIYIPDFLIAAKQANGRISKMLIEIKPEHEKIFEKAMTARDTAMVMRNQAKWKAAAWWCQRRGLVFRVLSETDLFGPQAAPAKRGRKR